MASRRDRAECALCTDVSSSDDEFRSPQKRLESARPRKAAKTLAYYLDCRFTNATNIASIIARVAVQVTNPYLCIGISTISIRPGTRSSLDDSERLPTMVAQVLVISSQGLSVLGAMDFADSIIPMFLTLPRQSRVVCRNSGYGQHVSRFLTSNQSYNTPILIFTILRHR